MNLHLTSLASKFALTCSLFASIAQADTAVCRLTSEGGTGLILTLTDSNSKAGSADSLFSGRGVGRAHIRPAIPLKIQYPTQFTVRSNYSKRYSVNIHANTAEAGVVFSLVSSSEAHPAFEGTATYGGPKFSAKYAARCEMQ